MVPTPPPVRIEAVAADHLHDVWLFVRQGLLRITVKVKPEWWPEDLYSAIRGGYAGLWMVYRAQRALGFFIGYPQVRPFSAKKEWLLWCAYTIPLRDRLPDDNVAEAVALSIGFMLEEAQRQGCDSLAMLSTRRGFERYGFRRGFTTWRHALA
jgi:hypothetical protein